MYVRWMALVIVLTCAACSDQGIVNEPTNDTLIDAIASDLGTQEVSSADQGAPDTGQADTKPEDACPGGFNCPCTGNDDCDSGFCIDTDDGPICTKTCDSDCPGGYACIGVGLNTDIVFICVPDKFEICAPCETSKDCAGTTAWCVTIPDGTKRCSPPCTSPDDCSVGFACAHLDEDEDGMALGHCIPTSGSCPCMETTQGEVRSCEVSNEHGTCTGSETCTETAWGGCDAAVPAAELCDGLDNNCDGTNDEGFKDSDNDGTKDCLDDDDDDDGDPDATDCDPTDPTISSDAEEICDGIDNNCVDGVDEGFPDSDADGAADCLDADDDQDGDPDVTDCAPLDPKISKNATEVCDGIDNNCDGETDEGFLDSDQDSEADCVDPDDDNDGDPDVTDCAPDNAAINSQAEEICDGIDNNCALGIDETFIDSDSDGLADCVDDDDDNDGDPDATDCEPTNAAINTLAEEVCDGIDNNCILGVDETFLDTDADTVADCIDIDDDNDGDPDATDCAPTDPTIHALAEELCDGIDNNCANGADETGCAGLGEACDADNDCFSDFCVEGICCESQCEGSCLSCLAELTDAASDGVCAPVAVGQDPDADCAPTGVCDGAAGCFDFGVPVLVPAGTVVAWTGLIAEIPEGWNLCDGTNDTPDLSGRFIRGTGGGFVLGDSGPGGITGTTSTDGAHTGPATASGGGSPNNLPYGYGRISAGDHAHALGGSLDLPEHYTLAYIKASAPSNLPAGSVTWSNEILGADGYEAFSPAAGRFIKGVTDDTREAAGNETRAYTAKIEEAGKHSHIPGGHSFGGSTKASALNSGGHTHDDVAIDGSVSDRPPYLVLNAVELKTTTGAVIGVILAYDGDLADLPPGWSIFSPLDGILPIAAGGELKPGDTGGTLLGPEFSGETLPKTVVHSHNSAPGSSGHVGENGALHHDFDWTHAHTWNVTVSPMMPFHTLHYISKKPTFVTDIVISQDTVDFDLKTALMDAGWDGQAPFEITVVVEPGVVVSASQSDGAAMVFQDVDVPGSETHITNYGTIVGRGGAGAAGSGNGFSGGIPSAEAGGPAMFFAETTASTVTLTNLGTIGGGGGGGGAGGASSYAISGVLNCTSPGGGGGGGAGFGPGGISPVPSSPPNGLGADGQAGSALKGGDGGAGAAGGACDEQGTVNGGGTGGNGGGLGQFGGLGTDGQGATHFLVPASAKSTSGGVGAPPGPVTIGLQFVQIIVSGDMLGEAL